MTQSHATDNEELTIREAYPQDAPAIAAMLVALCQFEGTPTPHDALGYAKRIKAMLEKNDHEYMFRIAELNNKPVGFVSYYYGFDLSSLSKGVHVGDLYVREEFRKLNVASKLLAHIAKQVMHNSGQWISLTALNTNETAQSFYRKRSAVAVPVQFYAWGPQGLEALIKHAA